MYAYLGYLLWAVVAYVVVVLLPASCLGPNTLGKPTPHLVRRVPHHLGVMANLGCIVRLQVMGNKYATFDPNILSAISLSG